MTLQIKSGSMLSYTKIHDFIFSTLEQRNLKLIEYIFGWSYTAFQPTLPVQAHYKSDPGIFILLVSYKMLQGAASSRPVRMTYKSNNLKGTHTVSKKMSKCQEPKFDNPETSILLLKSWNCICNTIYRTSNFQVELRFLQHVLLFTIKKRYVPFIYIVEYTL